MLAEATQEAGLPPLDAGPLPVDAILGAPPDGPPGGDVKEAICSLPWPCEEALAVAWCESRLDPAAVGRYGERGIYQVRPEVWGPVPGDAQGQVAQAYEIWREHGWRPWSCQPGR